MTTPRYWLYRWMDENGAKDASDVHELLQDARTLEDFREHAYQGERELVHPIDAEAALLAGAAIDLTGSLDCRANECRMQQVDILFRRAWHYFDVVAVSDQITHEVAHHWGRTTRFDEWLYDTIQFYADLRAMGAADLLEFRQKPRFPPASWRKELESAGIELPWRRIDEMSIAIARKATFGVCQRDLVGTTYRLDHPILRHSQWVTLPNVETAGRTSRELADRLATRVTERFMVRLAQDLLAARRLGAPLGVSVELHREVLKPAQPGRSVEQIAFELYLPVLESVPLSILVQLRKNENEAFQRFRTRLREAISELCALRSDETPARIAREIRRDLLEPELRAIRDRLSRARQLMAQRVGLSCAVGGVATTCGLLFGPAGYAAGAIGAVLGTQAVAAAVEKYLEERSKVSLSDMYFLWEAVQHKSHSL